MDNRNRVLAAMRCKALIRPNIYPGKARIKLVDMGTIPGPLFISLTHSYIYACKDTPTYLAKAFRLKHFPSSLVQGIQVTTKELDCGKNVYIIEYEYLYIRI